MFENKTYESLLKEKLDRVDAGYDKREGSVIYDALAPNSAETAQVYGYLDWMFCQMFGDTAEREYLIRIAEGTRGITPGAATHAVLKGVFNIEVPLGSRFSIGVQNYVVTERIDTAGYHYKLQCEQAGAAGNRLLGALVPVTYIEGLAAAELTEVLIPGEDEEDTEVFRQRWRAAFQSKAFGGNRADYREKITEIAGVGGCKVHRAQDALGKTAGNHVRCVIIASDFGPASGTLVKTVQQIMDPGQDMEGDGYAPIGHIVHIQSVKARPVAVSAQITYDTGYSFAAVKSYLEQAVDNYLMELNRIWEESGDVPLVVRIAKIESALLDVTGVRDITGTTLNHSEQNLILEVDEIAVRGEING